ncbi:sigma-70 family RNA polymerase sigma factor [Actinoplanes sp. CA-142083]|uniref:sigma-70 family RNA polymerase sigma factor n=1 Tax=Actinoplanes sp. CA-142083 TaxID=3239903 RepID=UPI003D9249E3
MDDEPTDGGIEAPSAAARQADEKAARDLEFTLFYTKEMHSLVTFLIVHGARTAVAMDAAQDAMTEAYRHWEELDHPRAWIRTVAKRAWWRRTGQDSAEDPGGAVAERVFASRTTEADEIDNRHTFLEILKSLPPDQREVMAWTYDGYQPTEIAAILRIPATRVRSRLRDARAALRARYDSGGEKP